MAKTAQQRGRANRRSGHSFENQCAKDLFQELGIEFKRNLDQTREASQGDLISSDPGFPFLVECKRRSKGNRVPAGAWNQAVAAAQAMQSGGVRPFPAVLYRYPFQRTFAVVPYAAISEGETGVRTENTFDIADITFEAFCKLSREIMAWRKPA